MDKQSFRQALTSVQSSERSVSEWVVACSGGLDSCVLLDCVRQHAAEVPMRVIHIDHQLQTESKLWSAFVAEQCQAMGIDCKIVPVDVQADGRGEEAAARAARYAVFEAEMRAGSVLLMGHHLDDQAETVLLRLLRGSGPAGLAGIPASRELGRGRVLRPLLDYSRAQLLEYAQAQGLDWREDPGNEQTRYDRNYLRQTVLPLLEARWPGYRSSFADIARIQKGYSEQLEQLASADLGGFDPREEAFGLSLNMESLRKLPMVRVRNVLAVACRQADMPAPPRAQVEEIMQSLLNARADAQPVVQWSGVQARRFAQRLYLLNRLPLEEPDYHAELRCEPAAGAVQVELPGGSRLNLRFAQTAGPPFSLQLRFRQSGDRVIAGGVQSKSLSNWFQEQAVPAWLRQRMPLVLDHDVIIAIGDLWLSAGGENRLAAVELDWPGYK